MTFGWCRVASLLIAAVAWPVAAAMGEGAQPSAAITADAVADEILVTAERLRKIRLDTRFDQRTGKRRCIVRRSTGLAALDLAVCTATIECAAVATSQAGMSACMAPRFAAIGDNFAKRAPVTQSAAQPE